MAGYGAEKIKIKESAPHSFGKTTVKGIRGNFSIASGQRISTRTKYGGPLCVTYMGTTDESLNYDELLISTHMYGNLNYK